MLSLSIQREENNERRVRIFLVMSSGGKKGNEHKIKYRKIYANVKKTLIFNYDGDQTGCLERLWIPDP